MKQFHSFGEILGMYRHLQEVGVYAEDQDLGQETIHSFLSPLYSDLGEQADRVLAAYVERRPLEWDGSKNLYVTHKDESTGRDQVYLIEQVEGQYKLKPILEPMPTYAINVPETVVPE